VPARRTWPRAALVLAVAALPACGSRGQASDAGRRFERDWAAHPAVFTLNGATEIDALGDPHGDPDVTFRTLAAAGLISRTTPVAWTGGTKVLVLTGDVIDKGASALPTIDLFIALEPQARAAGGRVVVTLGNHEAEFLAAPTDAKTAVFQTELRGAGLDPAAVAAGSSPYGAWLRNLPVAALIDDWFFCHSGDNDGDSAAAVGKKFRDAVEGAAGYGDPYLIGSGSILEANAWWLGKPSSAAAVDDNLAAVPAHHVVFGHDPGALQFPDDPAGDRAKGALVARYDGRLFAIDGGMSYAVGYSNGALLRVVRGATTAASTVASDGTMTPLWP
jgi:hypothetical protein